MAVSAKNYQNVSFKELVDYSKNNPNRHRKLGPIEILETKSIQDTSLDYLGLKGYTAYQLDPTGLLSLIVCISDPQYYLLAQKNIRTQLIIDLATKLQQETDKLKDGPLIRKRKRMYQIINTIYNQNSLEDKDYNDFFQVIDYMRNVHFILMKEAVQQNTETDEKQIESNWKGDIVFSTNPTRWKKDNPIWVADYRGRWVAVPTELSSKSSPNDFAEWLSIIEQKGWTIQWSDIDGTKVEYIQELSTYPDWNDEHKKLSKEVLGGRLSKYRIMKYLLEL
jgi:hypothetical protein